MYTVSYGIAGGATYLTAESIGWQYFPGSEGFVSGCIIGGFGIGAFAFSYLSTILINPDEIDSRPRLPGDPEYMKPFGPDIAKNLPLSLRYICSIQLTIMIICYFLI